MGTAGVILVSASELEWMAGVEVPLAVCIGLAMLVSSMVLLLEFDPSDMYCICPACLLVVFS